MSARLRNRTSRVKMVVLLALGSGLFTSALTAKGAFSSPDVLPKVSPVAEIGEFGRNCIDFIHWPRCAVITSASWSRQRRGNGSPDIRGGTQNHSPFLRFMK